MLGRVLPPIQASPVQGRIAMHAGGGRHDLPCAGAAATQTAADGAVVVHNRPKCRAARPRGPQQQPPRIVVAVVPPRADQEQGRPPSLQGSHNDPHGGTLAASGCPPRRSHSSQDQPRGPRNTHPAPWPTCISSDMSTFLITALRSSAMVLSGAAASQTGKGPAVHSGATPRLVVKNTGQHACVGVERSAGLHAAWVRLGQCCGEAWS